MSDLEFMLQSGAACTKGEAKYFSRAYYGVTARRAASRQLALPSRWASLAQPSELLQATIQQSPEVVTQNIAAVVLLRLCSARKHHGDVVLERVASYVFPDAAVRPIPIKTHSVDKSAGANYGQAEVDFPAGRTLEPVITLPVTPAERVNHPALEVIETQSSRPGAEVWVALRGIEQHVMPADLSTLVQR